MKLLLTGGTGFFGKALLRHWLAACEAGQPVPDVTLLSRDPRRFAMRHPEFAALPWLRLHGGDILAPASLPAGEAFTHVLHAAADSTLGPQLTPLQRHDQIVAGTRNLLDYAVARSIPRFLLTSSGGVYGRQPPDMAQIPETYCGMADPLRTENAYSVAKRSAEHLCALYQAQYGVQTVMARCFSFVGQDLPLNVHFAIGNFLRDALFRGEIVVRGDGSPIRSYMDQRDLALWLDVLLREGRAGEAYNVGSDAAISIADLAHRIRDWLAPAKRVHIVNANNGCNVLSQSDNLRNRYVPSIAKVQAQLGLQLQFSLENAVRDAARLVNPAENDFHEMDGFGR